MALLNDILAHNAEFVARDGGAPYRANRFPEKKLVVLTCMDTRLVELLPQAMAIRNGDIKLLKNAGAIVSHPFGSVMRSIIVAVYELGAQEIAVVGHHGCGMTGLSCSRIIDKARARGVADNVFNTLKHAGVDLQSWLVGFESPEAGVRESVQIIRNHPLLPPELAVHGLMMDPENGKLDLLMDGYQRQQSPADAKSQA